MSPETVGIIGLIALVVLLLGRMWVGFAMAFVGFLGFAYLSGVQGALAVLGTVPYSSIGDYIISVVPLFIFMGLIASHSGISADLYRSAYKWFGHFPGGLAIATVPACAGFAAICGESMAQAATIGNVAVPEMRKYKYNEALATGVVAAGGTLGILIPPSLGFIFYAILTEQSVGMLFMAGILPGILLSALFMIVIVLMCLKNKELGPPGPRTTFKEKILSLKDTWAMLTLFAVVMVGIYTGIFTPTEAGAAGAFGAIVISALGRKLTKDNFIAALKNTGEITAMIMALIIGAFVFMRFLAISKLPFALAELVKILPLPTYVVFALIILVYLLMGMFLDIQAAEILTVPIIFPTIQALGFDPIWFGVVMVLVLELGLITPPVGMNVFVLSGVTGTPLGTIFRGVVPFVISIIVCIVIITIFPDIALFIPNLMR